MRVAPKTIYQSLYLQSRGDPMLALVGLTTRAAQRPPGLQTAREVAAQSPDMINITDRPGEADDRPCPVTGRAI